MYILLEANYKEEKVTILACSSCYVEVEQKFYEKFEEVKEAHRVDLQLINFKYDQQNECFTYEPGYRETIKIAILEV